MKNLLLIFALSLCSTALTAQDLHYWTNQFGTRSSLLGGAVVGGVKDNSAIYYNPAALAFIDSGSVSINANLYQMETIKLLNAVGQSKNLKTLNIGSIPLLVGGRLTTKNPNFKLGYGILTPISFGFKSGARSVGFYPISSAADSPGDEEYTGQSSINAELRETTAILGMSWKMGANWSIGLSNMVHVRTHNYTEATLARMFLNNPAKTLVAINDVEYVNYNQITYVPKLGINYIHNNWAWGATLTLPGIRILGNATITADITGNQVNLFGNGRIDFTGNDSQSKIKTKYKYPISVAFGGIYTGTKMRFAFTGQYFTKIKPYSIVTPEQKQFLRPASTFPNGTTDKYLQVKTAAKQVLNVAVGFEKDLNERLVYTGSIRTDFSAYDDNMTKEKGIKPYITTWNLYHVTNGVTIRRGRHDLSLGLNLSFGADNDYPQQVNLDSPTEVNYLQGQITIAKARYFAAGLLLGYTYLFKK